jgi:hypothetical protein
MDLKKLTQSATPKKLGAHLARKPMPNHHGKGHDRSTKSVREEEHDGHHIVIRTTYTIEVDGKRIPAPLGVDNSGQVHCHSLPNYQTASAIDMVKALINNFPDDFAKSQQRPERKRAPAGNIRRKQ